MPKVVDSEYDCGCQSGFDAEQGAFVERCAAHMARSARREPPMPVGFVLVATVRNDRPVARVTFVDVLSDSREMDFDEDTAMDLAQELIRFIGQVRVRKYHPSLEDDHG